jgi:hypothetical protein
MRLALVHRLAFAVCLLALCSCTRRDSEEVARLTKELEAAKAEAAAAKAELARLKSPRPGDPESGAGEKSSSGNKKGERPKADGKVYRTPDMPEDVYPKPGEAFVSLRARTEKWCRANLPGRTVEFTGTVGDKIWMREKGRLVAMVPDGLRFGKAHTSSGTLYFGEPISLGGQKCQVAFFGDIYGVNSGPGFEPGFRYLTTEAEAEHLWKLKGKKVTFRTTIIEDHAERESVESGEGNLLILLRTLGQPSIDGFLPEANKAEIRK